MRVRTLVRPAPERAQLRCLSLVWLTLAVVLVFSLAGCRRGAGTLATPPQQAQPQATISGSIRVPDRAAPLDGRIVELVNVRTSERLRAETDRRGTFSFHVDPGEYRVVPALQNGEAVLRDPGLISVTRSRAEIDADIVIGRGRAARPRSPAYRVDDGLGSPMA